MNDVTELCLSVKDTYLEKSKELPVQKQFHFLSRLYLWSKNPQYMELLTRIRKEWWGPMKRTEERLLHIEEAQSVPKRKARKEYRDEAYQKYHLIHLYNRYFFKHLFDRALFGGGDIRQTSSCIQVRHLLTLRENLMDDRKSIFALSTPAVNFIALSRDFLGDIVPQVHPRYFMSIADEVMLPHIHDDTDARIYFYTHAVINGSRFYTEKISFESLPEYIDMVRRTEHILEKNYESLSLDHKCEFLVCAKLCGYESSLKERVGEELKESVAKSGMYFVNTQNTHRRPEKERSMSSMEHTNVLALMAFLNTEEL